MRDPVYNLKEITALVKRDILGRVANMNKKDETNSIEVVMEHVLRAGGGRGGNHLEIGTLFGGSAIAVALAKKEFNQPGMVVCVDPLNGYYQDKLSDVDPDYPNMRDIIVDVAVTPDILFKNIENFGVGDRVMVLQHKSEAIANLVDMKFTTAYIDGDHEGDAPRNDWDLVKDLVSRFVIFDNYGEEWQGVVDVCEYAAALPDWRCVYAGGISFVLERVMTTPLASLDVMERNGSV